jgi:hypothetical protein
MYIIIRFNNQESNIVIYIYILYIIEYSMYFNRSIQIASEKCLVLVHTASTQQQTLTCEVRTPFFPSRTVKGLTDSTCTSSIETRVVRHEPKRSHGRSICLSVRTYVRTGNQLDGRGTFHFPGTWYLLRLRSYCVICVCGRIIFWCGRHTYPIIIID